MLAGKNVLVAIPANYQDVSGYINYVEVLYCNFEQGENAVAGKAGALILYFAWLCVLFVGLGKAADDYLCPNLAVLSKILR